MSSSSCNLTPQEIHRENAAKQNDANSIYQAKQPELLGQGVCSKRDEGRRMIGAQNRDTVVVVLLSCWLRSAGSPTYRL